MSDKKEKKTIGVTDEYGNRILDLPDEEGEDALDSEPQLIYFPKYGDFQLSGLSDPYINISYGQARKIVEFINQVLDGGEHGRDT